MNQITMEDREEIDALIQRGYSDREIAAWYNISPERAAQIRSALHREFLKGKSPGFVLGEPAPIPGNPEEASSACGPDGGCN